VAGNRLLGVEQSAKCRKLLQGITVLTSLNAANQEKLIARRADILRQTRLILKSLEQAACPHQAMQAAQARRISQLFAEQLVCEAEMRALEREKLKLSHYRDMLLEKKLVSDAEAEEEQLMEMVSNWTSWKIPNQPAAS
jgi:succinate dehydrogenase/fumarate reductase-like Fe-S protein